MLQRLEEVAPPLKPIAITTSSGSTGLLLGSDEMQHEVVETLAAFKATNTGSWRELAESPSVSDQHKVLIAHAGVEIKLAKRAWQAHTAAELAARESFAEELQAFSLSVMSAAKQAARERALLRERPRWRWRRRRRRRRIWRRMSCAPAVRRTRSRWRKRCGRRRRSTTPAARRYRRRSSGDEQRCPQQ